MTSSLLSKKLMQIWLTRKPAQTRQSAILRLWQPSVWPLLRRRPLSSPSLSSLKGMWTSQRRWPLNLQTKNLRCRTLRSTDKTTTMRKLSPAAMWKVGPATPKCRGSARDWRKKLHKYLRSITSAMLSGTLKPLLRSPINWSCHRPRCTSGDGTATRKRLYVVHYYRMLASRIARKLRKTRCYQSISKSRWKNLWQSRAQQTHNHPKVLLWMLKFMNNEKLVSRHRFKCKGVW